MKLVKSPKVSNSLRDKILKNSTTKHTAVLSDSEFFKEKDVIPTGIPIIDLAFSGAIDGGLTTGLTLVCGPSKSYKSLICLKCVKSYLDKYPEAICIFYDSEGGITPEYLKMNGIDTDRVVHTPIDHLEMLKFDIVNQLNEIERGDKVIIMIDSIGNTASKKEVDDALEEKSVADMTRAKVLKGITRMITPLLVNKNIPCLAVCHTYQTLELYSKAVISGGTGIVYSASQAFIISKSQEKDADKDLLGWNFTLNVEKSRFVKEKSKLTFTVLYNSGIQKYSGLLDLAVEAGVVVKTRAKTVLYSKVDEDGVVSEKTYTEKKTNSDEFWNDIIILPKFKEFCSNKFRITSSFSDDSTETLEDFIED